MADAATPVMNEHAMKTFGVRMNALFETYSGDRRVIEEQWLRNLRQFRGIYDPDIDGRIPADQSRAYPKVTRTKVIGTVARLMEMMFPQTEKNWGIRPSPIPDLSQEDTQSVLDTLQNGLPEGTELPSEVIERAIAEFATKKCAKMEKIMEDQLDEISYISLCKRVVFSAVLYSAGVLKGPLIKTAKTRSWKRDTITGRYIAFEAQKLQPYFEVVPVWNHYPDLSAKTLEQKDGDFERHIMSRSQVTDLASRPDFMGDAIKNWLKNNIGGNYKERWWEQSLRVTGDRKNVTDLSGRKYELLEYWGFVDGHELKACGIEIADDRLSSQFEANVWTLDSVVIKAIINPFEVKIRPNHTFIYEEDDISILGIGLPAIMRDSQMGVCEATRMLLDNASVSCGPILEANHELLLAGQSMDVHAFKIFYRDGLTGSESQAPAIREIKVDSHIPELVTIIELFMNFADTETALPPPALGDVGQGGSEALRTQGGASMFLGAAALPIRDTVRNFDMFTESVIGSQYNWNMEFGTDEEAKGDFSVIARGSTSLVAKEVRAQSLDAFRVSLSEDERPHINSRKLLVERMKARDLPEDILDDEVSANKKIEAQAQNLAQIQALATAKAQADIKNVLTQALKNVALANKADSSATNDTVKTILEGLTNAISAANEPATGTTTGGS
jgi:hypothetical protein